MPFSPERLAELEQTRLALLAALGLGPRECVDCKATFTPPPYMECKRALCCPDCAGKRFEAWASSEEGQQALKVFNEKIKEGNAAGHADVQ